MSASQGSRWPWVMAVGAGVFAACVVHVALAASPAPCVYWTGTVEDTAAALKDAALTRVCVPADRGGAWRGAGFDASGVDASELAARQALPAPGVNVQVSRASATRSPWLDANGWRFLRSPSGRFRYDAVPAGRGALAIAEAYAYGADATVEIDPADLQAVGTMLAFLGSLPPERLPPVADIGVVDDGSDVMGEVLNLLSRRNLLFEVVPAPDSRFRINVALGTPAYPAEDAADPSAFALKVRRQLTDSQRTLRVYGTEVVVCRLTGDSSRRRLELLNYGGRDLTGVRIRVLGSYRASDILMNEAGRIPLEDFIVSDGATEFSIPRLTTYGVVELR